MSGILDREIGKAWAEGTYVAFKEHFWLKKIFKKQDSERFLAYGASMILDAQADFIGSADAFYPENKNIFGYDYYLAVSMLLLGVEMLLKGVILHHGYAINELTSGKSRLQRIYGGSSQLNKYNVITLGKAISLSKQLIDFSNYDRLMEASAAVSTSDSIPYPSSEKMLNFILFLRNMVAHRPSTFPSHQGTKYQMLQFLEYISQLEFDMDLANLKSVTRG